MNGSPSRRSAIRSGLWVVWAMAVAGLVAGIAWKLAAPVAKIRIQSDGGYYADPSPRQFVEADMWFAGITFLVAVVAGVLAWRWLRDQPTPAVVGLAVGGLVGSVLAWLVGKYLGRLDHAAALKAKVGALIDDSLGLGAKGLLGVLPVAAVATWLVLDLAAQQRLRRLAPTEPTEPAEPAEPAESAEPAGQQPT